MQHTDRRTNRTRMNNIDDEFDFVIASSLVEKNKEIICEYL